MKRQAFSVWRKQRIDIRNSRVFKKLFSSFLALVVLPMVVLCIDFVRYQRILENDAQSYEYALLEQVKKTVDERLESISQLAISLSFNDDIDDFVSGGMRNQSEINVAAWKIMMQFLSEKIAYNSVEDIMLYSPVYERVVTSNHSSAVPAESYALLEDEVLNSQLISNLQKERMYCDFSNLTPDQEQENMLFLLHTVPLWSTSATSQGTLAIQINTTSLFEKFNDIDKWQNGVVVLIGTDGSILAHMGDSALLDQIPNIFAENQADELTCEGERYSVFSVSSRHSGMQYLSIQSKSDYLSNLYAVLGSHVLIVLLLVVLEILIAFWLSWHNYSPVDKIMKTLQKDLNANVTQDGQSEYSIIEKSLQSFSHSLKEIQNEVELEIPKMQETMMQQWLNGTVNDYQAYKDSLAQIGILMPFPAYTIIYLEIIEYPTERTEERLLLRTIAHNKIMQFLPIAISWGVIHVGNDGFILVLNGTEAKLEAETEQALNEAVNHLRTELFLTVWAGLGIPTEQMQDIPYQSFRLKQIFHYAKVESRGGVTLLRSHANCSMLYYCPEELLHHISNTVSLGKSDAVLQITRDNFQRNFGHQIMQMELVHNYFYLLIDAVLRGLPTQDEGFTVFWNMFSPMASMARADSPNKMQSVLEDFVCHACRFVQEHRQSQAHELMQDILKYLEEHYPDNMLSLSSVAEQFEITPNYLSTFFKENTGKTFLNYLTALRIAKAKELLQKTNLTIAEIAAQVGYSGSNSFIRNYKKIEHVTPGEYRSALRG